MSTETWQSRREWQDIFKVLSGKNMQLTVLYPSRLSTRIEGEIKCFPDKQKLKEFVTTKLAPQEILRGSLLSGGEKKKKTKATKNTKDQRTSPETPTLQVTQWH